MLHAVDIVRRWGNQWPISSYAFESGNGKIENMIKASKGLDSQIIRHINQENALNILRQLVLTLFTRAFYKSVTKKHIAKCINLGADVFALKNVLSSLRVRRSGIV